MFEGALASRAIAKGGCDERLRCLGSVSEH